MNEDGFYLTAAWRRPPASKTRDVAEIRMAVGSEILTRLSDFNLREERDFVRSSAVSLALWFADNWWRLRFESLQDASPPSVNWRLRHEVTSASGGTLWPPIMIHSTGNRVLLTPAFARPLEIGALRYILPEVKTITGDTYEAGVDAFFDQVLSTCAKALDGEIISELVQSIRQERADPETAAWRRLEARLGYDPDTVPAAIMNDLSELERSVGALALDEAAAAAPGRNAAMVLQDALDAVRRSDIAVDLSIANAIPRVRILDLAAAPWELGKEYASLVRKAANLRDGPILSAAFSNLLQMRADALKKPGTARHLPYSARLRQSGERQQLAVKCADVRDRRFEFACALGDQIWADSDFGVVTKAKTDRQKFQRAFAQNLLVPYDALRDHVDPDDPSEDRIDRAARYFHVHPHVIRRILILEGVLPGETFEARLEAA